MDFRQLLCRGSAMAAMALAAAFAAPAQAADPWPIKVVIVTTFEVGADTGDGVGELQLWAEREHLDEKIDFPGGVHPLLTNKDHSVVAIVTGMSLVNSGASVMALGTDPRFDLSKAYWLVAGIAGVDPEDGTIGTAAWANYVFNDVTKSMDMREAPAGWPYGLYPAGSHAPNTLPEQKEDYGPDGPYPEVFPLNPKLTAWAYGLTKDVKLVYTPEMAAAAKEWTGFPNAQKPPRVMIGDSVTSNHYWHGKALNQWANDWARLFTGGKGEYVMTQMEDSAIAEAMTRLDRMKKADYDRLMVLRTGSNYSTGKPGQTTLESVMAPYPGKGMPAYEAAYRAGSVVVHELVANWPRYADKTPE
jgi:purine nucleoside permease